jgi:hypothetical protein
LVGGKYLLPMLSMLGGLLGWIAFAVWVAVADGAAGNAVWLAVVVSLALGGLVVFSGFR